MSDNKITRRTWLKSTASVLAATAAAPIQQISTHIDLNYPYQWQFSSVIRLLVPGASYAGITQIETDAVAANQD